MRCLNDSISEIRGNTISTLELPRAIPLWLSKQSSASSKITLFPNPVERLIKYAGALLAAEDEC